MQDLLGSRPIAGVGIEGHGRDLPQKQGQDIPQTHGRHTQHRDVIAAVQPPILIQQNQTNQQGRTHLPKQGIKQCLCPANGGGEEQIYVRHGKDRPALGKPVPKPQEKHQQKQPVPHGGQFVQVPHMVAC